MPVPKREAVSRVWGGAYTPGALHSYAVRPGCPRRSSVLCHWRRVRRGVVPPSCPVLLMWQRRHSERKFVGLWSSPRLMWSTSVARAPHITQMWLSRLSICFRMRAQSRGSCLRRVLLLFHAMCAPPFLLCVRACVLVCVRVCRSNALRVCLCVFVRSRCLRPLGSRVARRGFWAKGNSCRCF